MNRIIFSQQDFLPEDLYPFSLTRKVQDIRMGILTLREKWELALNATSADADISIVEKNNARFISLPKSKRYRVFQICSNLLPSAALVAAIKKLKPGESIGTKNKTVVACISEKNAPGHQPDFIFDKLEFIQYPWHIFEKNVQALPFDFLLLTQGRKSAPIHKTNAVENPGNIFLEEGAIVKHCSLNAGEGPVYIGKNALLMEGAQLRGAVAVGENAVVKMGARIYGATTIGPGCVAGGEIKNSVLFSYSNKAHDGYLGDSVVGAWCNMGAGTSNSNLKNTAGNIDVHLQTKALQAGIKCGVMMGDFSRTAINTCINTGTVIGVSANVFGSGFTPAHIPSFSWGFDGKIRYRLEKALLDAHRWKALKGQQLTEAEKETLTTIYKTR